MASRLTAAMEEAFAARPRNVVIQEVLSFEHDTWTDGPLHLCSNIEDPLAVHLEDGSAVTLKPCAFDVTPPGFGDDGPTPAQVTVDNISGALIAPFDAAIEAGTPIRVTYRTFRSDDLSSPGDVISGLRLRTAELSATSATGSLDFEQISDQAFPRRTYSLDEYPAIWTSGAS